MDPVIRHISCIDHLLQGNGSSSMLLLVEWVLLLFNWPKVRLLRCGFLSMNSPYTSALGATVIAAAGSQSKLEICKMYGGADHTVNYTANDWQKEVLRITGGKGVDVVYDPVGRIAGALLFLRVIFGARLLFHHIFPPESLKCIAFKGRALIVGFAAGQIEKV